MKSYFSFGMLRMPPYWIRAWAFLSLVSACKPDKGPDLPDDKPRIVNLSLAGLSDEAVQIDQHQNQITLRLPANFAPQNPATLMPTFELTPNAWVAVKDGSIGLVDFKGLNLCACSPEALRITVAERNPTAGSPAATTDYMVNLISEGALTVKPDNPGAFEYFLDDTKSIDLSVSNYYDGSLTDVVLKNPTNPSETHSLRGGCGYERTECPGQTNLLRVWPDPEKPVKPGSYQLELRKANGRVARADQPFVVRKGRTRLDYLTLVQRATVGGEAMLTGNNLFADDNLEILLTDPTGTGYRFNPSAVSPFGRDLTFKTSSTLKPGYYTLRLVKAGQVAVDCYRFSVTENIKQPIILGINQKVNSILVNAREFCPQSTPLTLQRGAATAPVVTFSAYPSHTGTLQLVGNLVTVGNPPVSFEVPLVLAQSYQEPSAYRWVEATLRIPADLPTGQYRFVVRLTEQFTKKVYQSEPYERVIDVQ